MSIALHDILSTSDIGKNYRIQIDLPISTEPVFGVIGSSFAINGTSASWENYNIVGKTLNVLTNLPVVGGVAEVVGEVLGVLKVDRDKKTGNATNVTSKASGNILQGAGLGSLVADSIQAWNGSGIPSIGFSITLVQLEPDKPVFKDVSKLLRGVLPSKVGASVAGIDGTVLRAPYNFIPANSLSIGGGLSSYNPRTTNTCTVNVGDWFSMGGLLMTSCLPTYSGEVNNEGFPIYCEVKLGFKPYKAISADEFLTSFASGAYAGAYSDRTLENIASEIVSNYNLSEKVSTALSNRLTRKESEGG